MKSIGQELDAMSGVNVSVECLKCGAILTLIGRQYTVKCPRCETYISLSPDKLIGLKRAEYRAKYGELSEPVPRCKICLDSGLAFIKEQVDGVLSDYAYRCLCKAGQAREDYSGWPVVPIAKVRHLYVAV